MDPPRASLLHITPCTHLTWPLPHRLHRTHQHSSRTPGKTDPPLDHWSSTPLPPQAPSPTLAVTNPRHPGWPHADAHLNLHLPHNLWLLAPWTLDVRRAYTYTPPSTTSPSSTTTAPSPAPRILSTVAMNKSKTFTRASRLLQDLQVSRILKGPQMSSKSLKPFRVKGPQGLILSSSEGLRDCEVHNGHLIFEGFNFQGYSRISRFQGMRDLFKGIKNPKIEVSNFQGYSKISSFSRDERSFQGNQKSTASQSQVKVFQVSRVLKDFNFLGLEG